MSGLGGRLREISLIANSNLTDEEPVRFWLGDHLQEVVTQGGSTVILTQCNPTK